MFSSERLTIGLFVSAVLGMFVALGWLGYEMTREPEVVRPTTVTGIPEVHGAPAPTSLPRVPIAGDDVTPGDGDWEELRAGLENLMEDPSVVGGEALLTLKSDALLHALRLRLGKGALELVSVDPRLRMVRVRFRDPNSLIQELREHGDDYESVGPNYLARVPGLPPADTDEANHGGTARYGSEGLDTIGATGDRSTWGRGVTTAVLDTGILDHPTLEGVDIQHVDLVDDGSEFNGHGTAMATLIAGQLPNAEGVAQGTRLLDVRVADSEGTSNTALVASGIVKAVDLGARVINISLGSFGSSQVLENAVSYALDRNVVIVAAGGNEQLNMLAQPAAQAGVISVGAVDANGQQAYFSNSGESLTISAPGVGIVSGYVDGRVVIGSGTSQAAALVSGVATTLVGRGYAGQNVSSILTDHATATGAPSDQVGAGIVRVPEL